MPGDAGYGSALLGYHYYTELAHSAGMSQAALAKDLSPRERVRAILEHLDRIDNTAQYSWFLEIAQTFLGFKGNRVTDKDCDSLCDAADRLMKVLLVESRAIERRRDDLESLSRDLERRPRRPDRGRLRVYGLHNVVSGSHRRAVPEPRSVGVPASQYAQSHNPWQSGSRPAARGPLHC